VSPFARPSTVTRAEMLPAATESDAFVQRMSTVPAPEMAQPAAWTALIATVFSAAIEPVNEKPAVVRPRK